jgi:hypothetical protein
MASADLLPKRGRRGECGGLSPRRIAVRVAQGVLLVIAAWTLGDVAFNFDHRYWTWVDFQLYRDAAASWLGGHGFYHAFQLVGPYGLKHSPQPVLYPPVTLWLLVPFVYLPAALWWVIPVLVALAALWWLKPRDWVWVALLLCALWPDSPEEFIDGNPVLWAWAAVWAGVVVPGPAAIALFKPTVAPFALAGMRHRRWWLVLAAGILAAVPFGTMWGDYVTASRNLQAPMVYFVRDVPLMAMPILAWVGRSRDSAADPRAWVGALRGVARSNV